MEKIIIGIETSCDETSVAIAKNGEIIDEITVSSATKQCDYGGVVPEVATRNHQKYIHQIFNQILLNNNLNVTDINAIAYTNTPGLPGCLHVGICFAKMMSTLLNVPAIAVNHLYAHAFSPFINTTHLIEFPILGVVISGGNTILYKINSYTDIAILNDTVDDAVGEVYDKVARSLGLGYPGGPKIDKLFQPKLATINFLKNNFEKTATFSYSGLKTSVINYIHNLKQKNQVINVDSIASSFQKTIIDDVIKKIDYQLSLCDYKSVCVGGGVAANSYFREQLKTLKIPNLFIAPLKYTGDQASMIAFYGDKLFAK